MRNTVNIQSFLTKNEQVLASVCGLFEEEAMGVNYVFGELLLSNKRIFLCTEHLIGGQVMKIYPLEELISFDKTEWNFTLHLLNGRTTYIKTIWIQKGNPEKFQTILGNAFHEQLVESI